MYGAQDPSHLSECVTTEYLSVYKGYANPVIAEESPTQPPDAVDLVKNGLDGKVIPNTPFLPGAGHNAACPH